MGWRIDNVRQVRPGIKSKTLPCPVSPYALATPCPELTYATLLRPQAAEQRSARTRFEQNSSQEEEEAEEEEEDAEMVREGGAEVQRMGPRDLSNLNARDSDQPGPETASGSDPEAVQVAAQEGERDLPGA
eukprot:3044328-Rhodomonas_salina.1